MDVQSLGLGLAGIFVSILTFGLGYRQTIGARQIRITAANDALVETLLRVVVVEDARLSAEDLEAALSGLAAKIGVPVNSLMSAGQVADVLHHQILASDLITKADRDRALETATSLRKDLVPSFFGNIRPERQRVQTSLMLGVLGLALATSALGVAVVSILRPSENPFGNNDLLLQFAAALGLALLFAFLLTIRYRTSTLLRTESLSNPTLRELLLYPDEAEGVPQLGVLNDLSPFAVRNLFQLGQDEVRSLRKNVPPGLRGNPEYSLGLQELLDKRLAEEVQRPRGARKKSRWYGLTPKGRSVSRLLQPSVEESDLTVPDYLISFVAQPQATDGKKEHSSDAVAASVAPPAGP